MADSVLDLSTEFERPVVRIDGADYEMRAPEEFSLDQIHELGTLGKRLERLMGKDQLKDAERDDLRQIATDMASTVMIDIPRELMVKLSDVAKMKIAQAFTDRAGISRG